MTHRHHLRVQVGEESCLARTYHLRLLGEENLEEGILTIWTAASCK